MGRVKQQGQHEVCWALVTAEIVSAVKHIKGHDKMKVEYSFQDIVNFTNPKERCQLKTGTGHCCYPWYIHSGLEYVRIAGVQREEDRPFQVDCKKKVVPRDPLSRLSYISKTVPLRTIEDALTVLHEHPVAAAIPIFSPDYEQIGNKIYRSPTTPDSRFLSMHAVNIIGAGEENGEKYVLVRSSHGEDIGIKGNLEVSIEIVMMRLTPSLKPEFGKHPQALVDSFVYPETCAESCIIDIDRSEYSIVNID